MKFLKISGLVIGAGSVVGAAGSGIYYAINKKTQFDGKLVFEKKTNENYEVKLIDKNEYESEKDVFNKGKNEDNKKYDKVNKIVNIYCQLNIQEAKNTLKEIFKTPLSLSDITQKIKAQEIKLEELFGNAIYTELTKIN